ncbi:MAG: hypothetical protein IJ877_02765 [Candidatus Gastranaerophilales bacterium]|nr:hypothetical protein [Candidatus Gastranaerophilales bacterium]
MLENLLSASTQKQVVGVALTPGIGLEAIIYDRNKNIALKYGRKKVEYNFSTREIQDYVEFKTALSDLMREMNVAPKSMAYLVLPNVYFDFIEIPSSIAEAEIRTALLSKAEEFYLFKKEEPISGWCNVVNINDTSQKRLAYTSFQKNAVDNLKDIFSDVGLQLVGVESSYSATIRGLYSIGLLDDVLSKKDSWTAMMVNTNSFTLLYFDADNLLECTEVPIAIKSFSTEEAYAAISSSASQLLDNFSSSKLYIISQTDDICAEVLKRQMQFDKDIVTVDSNKYAKKPLIDVMQSPDFNKANAMTLSAVGASNIKTELNLLINVMADDPSSNLGVYFTTSIMGTVVDVTSELVAKLSIILAVICLLVFGAIALACSVINSSAEENISEISSEISNIDKIIAAESKEEVVEEIDMNAIIDEIAQTNVKAIKYYDSIASDIPKNIWLTQYYNKQGDKILVAGVAESIIDIYEYYKNLKIVSPESDIKLTELKVLAYNENTQSLFNGLSINTDKTRLYTFEISNTTIDNIVSQQAPKDKAVNEGDIIVKPAPPAEGENVEQMAEQVKPAE